MGWGDELIVTGQVKMLQQTDPRKVRIVYEKGRWHEAWDRNPRIASPAEEGDFQELRPRDRYLRPYCTRKELDRWTWRAWGPPVGELFFAPWEEAFGTLHAGSVVLEPNLKGGASPNKQWGWERWNELARLLMERGIQTTQLGNTMQRMVIGARYVQTQTVRQAAALIARARAIVVPEGALHHIAAAVGTPAVVIYGGYISPQVTGYPGQVGLFTGGGLGCGMRSYCKHCVEAMAKITPEQAAQELFKILREA